MRCTCAWESVGRKLTIHTASIFKRPGSQHAIQKQGFGRRVQRFARFVAVVQRPESRDDAVLHVSRVSITYSFVSSQQRAERGKSRYVHDFRPRCNQLAKRLGKRKIPTYQQSDFSHGRLKHLVHIAPRPRQVIALWAPTRAVPN
jgi:hypothetical protein